MITADTDTEFARIVDELTRRGFLAGGLGSAALLGLASCGSSGPTDPSSSAAAAPWSFTDDLGNTTTLPHRPTRIASLWDSTTATLWAAGLRQIVASQLADGNDPTLAAAHVVRTGMKRLSVGNTAQVDVEALAAAAPDLIIDITADGALATTSQQPQISKIAPVIGLNGDGPDVLAVIANAERLVRALGVPVADAADRERYDAAAARFSAALAAKPGLRVAFCWTDGSDTLYLYPPDGSASDPWLPTLAKLGMQFTPVQASTAPDAGGFGTVSWELVADLPVDLLFQTGGTWPIKNAGWKHMPAVRAGQAHNTDGWAAGWYLTDYANYADLLDLLTAVVEKSQPGIGPR